MTPDQVNTMTVVRAELKALNCADAPSGLADFNPRDPNDFALAVGATIGPPGSEGGDLFYFNVVTASWLQGHPPEKGFEFARHLVVTRWDYPLVERAISDLCRRTEGDNWSDVATKLSRCGAWEFEDYRE